MAKGTMRCSKLLGPLNYSPFWELIPLAASRSPLIFGRQGAMREGIDFIGDFKIARASRYHYYMAQIIAFKARQMPQDARSMARPYLPMASNCAPRKAKKYPKGWLAPLSRVFARSRLFCRCCFQCFFLPCDCRIQLSLHLSINLQLFDCLPLCFAVKGFFGLFLRSQ